MSNNESLKTKAAWNMETTKQFIQACLDQVAKQQRNGTTLTKKKWDNLKKEWSAWYKLFGKETGLGWDYTKHTVDAPNEWWERKQLENPLYGKFRNKGLPFKDELTILFKDIIADGKFAWAPSSGMLPSGIEEYGDGYRPYFEEGHVDIEEGSGDSEEGIDASLGVNSEFQHINLSSSQENNSQKSTGKRKRDVVCETTKQKKNFKVPASKQIANAISRIVSASESRSTIVSTFLVPGASIGEVMAEIQKMEMITSDPDFHSRCCQLMMFKPVREMFVSLKGYEQILLDWLKHAAYNPLPFMQN
ncbi:hypothetical protein HN873_043256 [Arachis hypogaea]